MTYISKKVDPALIALNKLNTCTKIQRLLIPQQRKACNKEQNHNAYTTTC